MGVVSIDFSQKAVAIQCKMTNNIVLSRTTRLNKLWWDDPSSSIHSLEWKGQASLIAESIVIYENHILEFPPTVLAVLPFYQARLEYLESPQGCHTCRGWPHMYFKLGLTLQ